MRRGEAMTPERLFHKGKGRPHSRPSEDGRFGWMAQDAWKVLDRWFDEHAGARAHTFALYQVRPDGL